MNDPTHIYITIPSIQDQIATNSRIAIIKAIRRISGLGLKESKDLGEAQGKHRLPLTGAEMISAKQYGLLMDTVKAMAEELKQHGVDLVPLAATIIEELRQLGIKALEAQEDQLASDIMQLVLAEKLRRGC
jgi:hypothetical protein